MYENSNDNIKKEIDILKTNNKELSAYIKKLNLNTKDYKSKEDLILDIIKKSIELKEKEKTNP
jgi:elongation factor P--beta-lysine ligase